MKLRILLLLLALHAGVFSQSNLREKLFPAADSIHLDSLSVVPGSLILMHNNAVLPDSSFHIDPVKSMLYLNSPGKSDSLKVIYRVFPYDFNEVVEHKSLKTIQQTYSGYYNPFNYGKADESKGELFKFDGLNKSGSISRGISFGNNQDVIVNSALNLQLSGKLSDNIDVVAAITDENIPFQPEGNTQQIQEFDKVFIQFSRNEDKLVVGDFETSSPNGYFLKYYKKAQGLKLSSAFKLNHSKAAPVMKFSASGAISKGKYSRSTINAVEGNQGPYRLTGAQGETFIIVLSGTEVVYLNGQRMERGQQNDYVIDYNTAEVTFTPKRLITKDSRIIIEFEYSDRNYTRTLFGFSDEFSYKKLNLRFNFFSEQDAKNQPINQSLNDHQKALLDSVGDSLSRAITLNVDSIAFNGNEVLYRKVFFNNQPVYEYSTNPDSAHFRVGFSLVGPGKGDYNQIPSSANGKVFQYVGKNAGSYLPLTLLVTPKMQQMFSLGGDYQLNKNSSVSSEVALSNYNQNLFSQKDKQDDQGLAFKVDFNNLLDLQQKTDPWKLSTTVHFEREDENFRFIERFRPSEFERDWNLPATSVPQKEILSGISFTFLQNQRGSLNYQFRNLQRGLAYQGFQNLFNTNLFFGNYHLQTAFSQLNTTERISNTSFTRHREDLSRKFRWFIAGVREEQEINRFKSDGADTLQPNSFSFYEWQTYLTNPDTSKNKFGLNYGQRYDYIPKEDNLNLGTTAKTLSFTTELSKNSNHHFSSMTTYRMLQINDPSVSKIPENSLANRIEYNTTLLKGAINSSTFYQITSGQELKKDYTFLEVARGKGTYIWNDYNHDGIKQKDEYEPAVYADTAAFVKILIPSNEYVSTHSNDLNQVLNISPVAFLNPATRLNRFVNRFSNLFAVQLGRKTLKTKGNSDFFYINPFEKVNDSALISTQYTLRNIFYFNRTRSRFGADLNIQQSGTKTLLTDGFELRNLLERGGNVRFDISREFNQSISFKLGTKKNFTELYTERRYTIDSREVEPKLNFQPTPSFRATLSYRYVHKENILNHPVDPENATHNRIGLEFRYSTVKVGSLQLRFNYIKTTYNNGLENTPLGYEMLEGLKKGLNLTWGLSLQRNLSDNTQLNVNYDGRQSEGTNVIHTGGVQLRAYF